MNLFVAMKIAEYYPERLAIMSILDEKTGKWSSAIWIYEFGMLGEALYEAEVFDKLTEDEAIASMEKLLVEKMLEIKTMSN